MGAGAARARGRGPAAHQRVEVLADEEAQRREHGDASMLELDLAVEADLALRRLLAEAGGVEEAQRRRHAGEVLHVELRRLTELLLRRRHGITEHVEADIRHVGHVRGAGRLHANVADRRAHRQRGGGDMREREHY